MTGRISAKSLGVLLAAGACIVLLLLIVGCSEKPNGRRGLNLPPDTQISFGPKEQSTTYYKVQAYWYGTDEDGTIDHYEVALVKNATREILPNLDLSNLTWVATAKTESSFVLAADSCCSKVGLNEYGLSYWGVLVRAVDNDGGVDSTPASLFFQASNAIPTVRIKIPKKGTTSKELVSPHTFFQWQGADIDGDVTKLNYKYLFIPESALPGGDYTPKDGTRPALPPLEHDSSGVGHASPPTGYWSKWVPADCTFVKDLDLSVYKGSNVMAFVTCRDEGGAILPENLYSSYNGDNNWVRLLISRVPLGVTCMIDGGPLGTRRSLDRDIYTGTVAGLFRGQTVSFKIWSTEDRSQGSLVSAYRYYYDDPEDPKTSTWNYWTSVDPLREHTGGVEWTVKYPPPDGKPFEPTIGPHIFVAELRDINLEVTHSEFRIEVLPGPKGKERLVYLVDDDHAKFLDTPLGPSYDQATHAFWSDVLDGYNWESFNTRDGTAYTKEVPIRRVGDATTVIWQADFDDQAPDTYLLKVCANLGNYLNSYVKVGGNLIIIGRDPVYDTMYWPDAPNVLDAAVRSKYTNLDFTPRISAVDSSKIYNFMWEAFGIVKMQSPSPGVAFKTLAPCEAGWDSIRTDLIPSVPSYAGKMDYAFFITKVRDDIDVHKMYSVIQLDSHGLPVGTGHCSGKEDEMKLVAVYVPGDGQRGYAAYIAIPSWFFDHDQVKVMIRKLLDMFGEPRTP